MTHTTQFLEKPGRFNAADHRVAHAPRLDRLHPADRDRLAHASCDRASAGQRSTSHRLVHHERVRRIRSSPRWRHHRQATGAGATPTVQVREGRMSRRFGQHGLVPEHRRKIPSPSAAHVDDVRVADRARQHSHTDFAPFRAGRATAFQSTAARRACGIPARIPIVSEGMVIRSPSARCGRSPLSSAAGSRAAGSPDLTTTRRVRAACPVPRTALDARRAITGLVSRMGETRGARA